jgi:hypothetical protein
MKPIKAFGLAVMAALLMMAFIGAGSATAEETALCSQDQSPCQEGNLIEVAHLVGRVKFKTSILSPECDVLFYGKVMNRYFLGGARKLISSIALTNCTKSCAIAVENGPPEITMLREGHETATVNIGILFHVECGAFIDCFYIGEGLEATAKGPLLSTETNGELKLTEQALSEEEESVFCPEEAILTLSTTPLIKTYITQ